MSMTSEPKPDWTSTSIWHPVATAHDVRPRLLFRGELLGRELVLWRADDGFVNVWENRCLHRGVRLSIGVNDGAELVCRYHGWRYANRSAGCTYIPAHPANSPARTITNRTFPVVERYGLIWTADDPVGDVSAPPALDGDTFTLRSLPVNAPADDVLAALTTHRFLPTQSVGSGDALLEDVVVQAEPSGCAVTLAASDDAGTTTAVFFVQPLTEVRSVIRGVVAGAPTNPNGVLRHHAERLGVLVRMIEADDRAAPSPTASPALEVPVMLPASTAEIGRAASLSVAVVAKRPLADDIVAFELAPTGSEALPTVGPGAHIDLHLPNEMVRQYSITNAPGEGDRYRIAVKLDPSSRGGSRYLHDHLDVGDVLEISEPRNGFPLRRNVPHTMFIAGGIGITPLISMASALASSDLDFTFHQFSANSSAVAFRDRLEAFGDRFTEHLGLTPEQTQECLAELLAGPDPMRQLYCCGPPPMLDAIRAIAVEAGWPADSVHFEYFENTNDVDLRSRFTIELARSAQSLEVPPGKTILQVLRENEVPIASSCETGACGTCQVSVLGGEPVHQDVYLNAAEHAAGQVMMTCVSRAAGGEIVLDL